METYVALLRGINVGGNNKIPMKELAQLFVRAACTNVQTYIQSGNVIFRAEPEAALNLPQLLSKEINGCFGCQVPVILRTGAQILQVLEQNPFLKTGMTEDSLHVLFLSDIPTPTAIVGLDPKRGSPDEFAVHGREVYLYLPNGAGNSKLTNAYFDSKLKTIGTARNWRTVKKLYEIMTSAGQT